MSDPSDRRIHSRFAAGHLKILIKSLRADDQDWGTGLISSVDFNRFGIAVETSHNFAIGDIVSVVIRTDDSTVAEVNGLVCNRVSSEYGFRLGIKFEHDGNNTDTSSEATINISEEILMIERKAATMVH